MKDLEAAGGGQGLFQACGPKGCTSVFKASNELATKKSELSVNATRTSWAQEVTHRGATEIPGRGCHGG